MVTIYVKGARSRYLALFLDHLKLSLIRRKLINNSLPEKTNIKEARINQKGTRMVKDGED